MLLLSQDLQELLCSSFSERVRHLYSTHCQHVLSARTELCSVGVAEIAELWVWQGWLWSFIGTASGKGAEAADQTISTVSCNNHSLTAAVTSNNYPPALSQSPTTRSTVNHPSALP